VSARPVALVTGAGRGIGRGIAVALAGAGFAVVINERSAADDTAQTVAAIEAAGGDARVVHGDVADLGGHAALLGAARAAFGRLDCLVNNAGVSVLSRGDLLDVAPESFDHCIAVNTRGAFFLAQAFARHLLASAALPDAHRSIVFVTSCNAVVVSLSRGEYCVSKAGAGMTARLFANRLAPHGIGVYEVQPGIIRTEMTLRSKDRYDALIEGGAVPSGRWGMVEDVGRVVATMARGDLPYTVGQAVLIDGGLATPRL
jgi:NAD(P)-dependent dehydrogenase (short-subunit alcohol dehydrogenase family)